MNDLSLPLVLMTHMLPADWISKLDGHCRLVVGPEDATHLSVELNARLAEAEGLYTLLTIPITSELLCRARKLRVISNMAAGVDNIDVPACTSRGIPVGNTPGVLTEATADLTMALLLSVARCLPEARDDALSGKWVTWSPTGWLGTDLNGATLGIIGMGKIGKAVARRAAGFGMQIVYSDPQPCDEPGYIRLSTAELLIQSDIVSLHTPLVQSTHYLLNSEMLGLMKTSAILINTARGAIIDLDALYTHLKAHKIAAAALDVTYPEPLPPEHKLYTLSNCLILPHIGSATHNTRRKMAELACDNLLAGLAMRPMPHCVNPEVYQNKE